MFCAKCRGEFRPEISVCPDCGRALVLSLPGPAEFELVQVFETSDASLLPVLESVLSAADIPFLVRGEHLLGLDPVGRISGAVGFKALSAKIMVPAEQAETAKMLLEERDDGPAL